MKKSIRAMRWLSVVVLASVLCAVSAKAKGSKVQNKGKSLHSKHHAEPAVACLNDCQGNGLCDNGMCLCEPAFEGDDCSVNTCAVIGSCGGNGGKCGHLTSNFACLDFLCCKVSIHPPF